MLFWRATLLLVLLEVGRPVHCWNATFLRNLVAPLRTMMKMEDLVWFISERMTTEQTEDLQSFIIGISSDIGLPQAIYTNRTDVRVRYTSTKRSAFSIVFVTSPTDPIFGIFDKTMRGRKNTMSVVILASKLPDIRDSEPYLRVLMKAKCPNSLFYYATPDNGNELVGYTQFPEFAIENRTDFMGYFRKNNAMTAAGGMDVKGYKFLAPVQLDLPYVFRDDRSHRVVGTSYQQLKIFTEYLNGSLQEYPMAADKLGGNVIDMHEALDLIRDRKMQMLAHAYALFSIDDEIDKSYPIMVVQWCLMLPLSNRFSRSAYLMKPFQTAVWQSVFGVFLALFAFEVLAYYFGRHPVRRRPTASQDIGAVLLDSFCLCLNVVTTKIIPLPPSLPRFMLFSCLFFYGIFLWANYTSFMGSILTVVKARTHIDTIDDLIQLNISVMIIDYELEFLLEGNHELSREFMQIIRPVDSATFHKHQSGFDTTYAYFVTEDKWNFLNMQQKHLKGKKFKFSDICFGSYHLAYPMIPDSPLWRSMQYFIIRTHSSGLLKHFESISFDTAVHSDLVTRFTEATEFTAAGMTQLVMIFGLIIFMGIISILVFFCELAHKKYTTKQEMKKIRKTKRIIKLYKK